MADHRFLHTGNFLFQRQALEADYARDALADRLPDLAERLVAPMRVGVQRAADRHKIGAARRQHALGILRLDHAAGREYRDTHLLPDRPGVRRQASARSEEHTSELQSLMRNSYAVFCLKKKQYQKRLYYYD